MKLKNLQEAKYSAPRAREMFFIVEESDDITLIGPFVTSKDANVFSKHIFNEYGDMVTLNHEVIGVTSPEQYDKDIKQLRNWMLSD